MKRKYIFLPIILSIIVIMMIGLVIFFKQPHTKNISLLQDISSLEDITITIDKAKAKLIQYDLLHFRKIPYTVTRSIYVALSEAKKSLDTIDQMLALYNACQDQDIIECLNILEFESHLFDIAVNLNTILNFNWDFLPPSLHERYQKVAVYKDAIKNYIDNRESFQNALGANEPRTYIIALQNTAEARPTGGYIGSMIFVTLWQGKVIEWEAVDSHHFDQNASTYITAPDHLYFIKRMSAHESNIYPDTKDSAEYLMDNALKQGNKNIDGVVFVSVQILEYIFDSIGTLDLHGWQIDKDNYFDIIRFELEKYNVKEYPKQKNPKEFFFTFIEAVFAKLQICNCPHKILHSLQNIQQDRVVSAFMRDSALQDMVQSFGLYWPFYPTKSNHNFFAPIFSSYFSKASRFVTKHVDIDSAVMGDSLQVQATIDLHHTFDDRQYERIASLIPDFDNLQFESQKYLLRVFGQDDYHMMLEVYLPKDAYNIQFLNAPIIELDQDNSLKDYKVLRIVDSIQAQDMEKYVISYSLPLRYKKPIDIWYQSGQDVQY